jgi:hypothetical protein
VAVEKLLPPKFAKIKLRYDALQTAFLIFKIFCIPKFWLFRRKLEFFNSHRRFHSNFNSFQLNSDLIVSRKQCPLQARRFIRDISACLPSNRKGCLVSFSLSPIPSRGKERRAVRPPDCAATAALFGYRSATVGLAVSAAFRITWDLLPD